MNDDQKSTFMCQFCDYMANPAIPVKYFTLANNVLLHAIPVLQNNQDAFRMTTDKISSLASECYDM